MAQKKSPRSNTRTSELSKLEKNQSKQQRLIGSLTKREEWMKWAIVALSVLVLFLILFFGYATDWGHGLSKDSDVDGTGTSLDAAKTADGTGTGASTLGTSGSNGTSTNGSSGTSSNAAKTNSADNTAKESTSTSTTNNSTTTTNNTTTPTTPTSGLLPLYLDTSIGDNISTVVDSLSSLPGVSQTCHNELLIQVCDFTDGALTVTTKNLLGTGIITSIVKNF
jgi:hypothetical protein